MRRKDFIELAAKFSLASTCIPSLFFPASHTAQSKENKFSGSVLIIGAGAAGMSAAYLLSQAGIDVQVLEAAAWYGGRLKNLPNFADFPIDLGAEWIHTNPDILKRMAQRADIHTKTMTYSPQSIYTWNRGKLHSHRFMRHIYSEWKFRDSSWFLFFEQYILPHIASTIRLQSIVSEIDYGGDSVFVKTRCGKCYQSDKVLFTGSIKTLQSEQIQFYPALDAEKKSALSQVFMGDGIKLFIEFSERFYPDILAFGSLFSAFRKENKFVYDAAFGKESQKHILGLFAINEEARVYTNLQDEARIIEYFLAELDTIFQGKASTYYKKHHIQNWSQEPFIQGSYSSVFHGKKRRILTHLRRPLGGKLYFAGEALSLHSGATVHGAWESAELAVLDILNKKQ